MTYQCILKPLGKNEILISAEKPPRAPSASADQVVLEVESTVVDLQHIRRLLTAEGDWLPPKWGSLYGKVVQIGNGAHHLRLGDWVSAIGPVASRVALDPRGCVPVPASENGNQAPFLALLVTLVRLIRSLQIEIGESVLILGSGLTATLMARLAFLSGAGAVAAIGCEPAETTRTAFLNYGKADPHWALEKVAADDKPLNGAADLLIDVTGDVKHINEALSLVRDSGRVMLLGLGHTSPADFDFYRYIHRRSLQVTTGTLADGLPRWAQEGCSPVKNEFIDHLLKDVWLDPVLQPCETFYLASSVEHVAPLAAGTSLMLHWREKRATG
jgi:NADPH:quinone reductase-like Zn-dependent oxidoreductase